MNGAPAIAWGPGIGDAAGAILRLEDPEAKAEASVAVARLWREGALAFPDAAPAPPDRPGRLDRPELLPPAEMPRRRASGIKGRIALLHALAHIELNAINLAWDMIARFGREIGERAFVDDWVGVASDEGRHFLMLRDRLAELGGRYGDLPAHDGLWEAAEATADTVLARLAVVPMVLEARGLDVCPDMIDKLRGAGDLESAMVLEVIYREEVGHVRVGWVWFEQLCSRSHLPLKDTWQTLVRKHFRGSLKAPFNEEARDLAGLPRDFYRPLAGG